MTKISLDELAFYLASYEILDGFINDLDLFQFIDNEESAEGESLAFYCLPGGVGGNIRQLISCVDSTQFIHGLKKISEVAVEFLLSEVV